MLQGKGMWGIEDNVSGTEVIISYIWPCSTCIIVERKVNSDQIMVRDVFPCTNCLRLVKLSKLRKLRFYNVNRSILQHFIVKLWLFCNLHKIPVTYSPQKFHDQCRTNVCCIVLHWSDFITFFILI